MQDRPMIDLQIQESHMMVLIHGYLSIGPMILGNYLKVTGKVFLIMVQTLKDPLPVKDLHLTETSSFPTGNPLGEIHYHRMRTDLDRLYTEGPRMTEMWAGLAMIHKGKDLKGLELQE